MSRISIPASRELVPGSPSLTSTQLGSGGILGGIAGGLVALGDATTRAGLASQAASDARQANDIAASMSENFAELEKALIDVRDPVEYADVARAGMERIAASVDEFTKDSAPAVRDEAISIFRRNAASRSIRFAKQSRALSKQATADFIARQRRDVVDLANSGAPNSVVAEHLVTHQNAIRNMPQLTPSERIQEISRTKNALAANAVASGAIAVGGVAASGATNAQIAAAIKTQADQAVFMGASRVAAIHAASLSVANVAQDAGDPGMLDALDGFVDDPKVRFFARRARNAIGRGFRTDDFAKRLADASDPTKQEYSPALVFAMLEEAGNNAQVAAILKKTDVGAAMLPAWRAWGVNDPRSVEFQSRMNGPNASGLMAVANLQLAPGSDEMKKIDRPSRLSRAIFNKDNFNLEISNLTPRMDDVWKTAYRLGLARFADRDPDVTSDSAIEFAASFATRQLAESFVGIRVRTGGTVRSIPNTVAIVPSSGLGLGTISNPNKEAIEALESSLTATADGWFAIGWVPQADKVVFQAGEAFFPFVNEDGNIRGFERWNPDDPGFTGETRVTEANKSFRGLVSKVMAKNHPRMLEPGRALEHIPEVHEGADPQDVVGMQDALMDKAIELYRDVNGGSDPDVNDEESYRQLLDFYNMVKSENGWRK